MSNTNKTFFGHPIGLSTLFFTEMWERFSFYGMRAILVLYMTKALLFDKELASTIYGNYTGLIYLTPLLGGYISDKFWGNRKSIIFGGVLMAIGQMLLFTSGNFYETDFSKLIFYCGLGFLILGNGFFKPNISSMVGQLYPQNDKKLDSAFTIFYMGINVGAFIAPLVCGYVGDTGNPQDFKFGFLAAGLGMIISLIWFILQKDKYIVTPDGIGIGLPPKYYAKKTETGEIKKHEKLTREEVQKIIVIFVVSFFVIFFWAAFEQAGASLTFFADEQTDRNLFGYLIPTSFFQSINPVSIVIFAPIFAIIWTKLGQKNLEPSSPMKQAIGLFLLSIGYLIIAFGVKDISPSVKVSMFWITTMYLLHTFGELAVSPIGLSLVVKLSPARFVSVLMGVWFLSTSLANKFAGVLSSFYPELNKPSPTFLFYTITNLYDFFMLFMFMSLFASIILFLLSKKLYKMMHGVH